MNVYVDTCALPLSGRRLRSGFVSLLAALAKRGDIKLFAPEVVRTEFENLRRERARTAAQALLKAIKEAARHFEIDGIYIPDEAESVGPLMDEFDALIVTLPVHADDAIAALHREATRSLPTRDGRGARDAAIWLTVVRHHADSKEPGAFITQNTKDFADRETRKLHDDLMKDVIEGDSRLEVYFSLAEMIGKLAKKVDFPSDRPIDKLLEDYDIFGELAREIRIARVFSDEESGTDMMDWSIWEVDGDLIQNRGMRVLEAYEVSDAQLVKCVLDADFVMVEQPAAHISARAWLESDEFGMSLVEVEDVTRR